MARRWGERIYGCPGHLQTFECTDAGKNKLSAIVRFFFTCSANGISKECAMCTRCFTNACKKFRAKRIEIGQGFFTSCNRHLRFSELTGAIQDLAIHGQMCIQSSCRHKQCFSWIVGTGTNVCIVDKDLIFPPNQNAANILLLSLALRCLCRSRKNDSAVFCFKRKETPPTQNLQVFCLQWPIR